MIRYSFLQSADGYELLRGLHFPVSGNALSFCFTNPRFCNWQKTREDTEPGKSFD